MFRASLVASLVVLPRLSTAAPTFPSQLVATNTTHLSNTLLYTPASNYNDPGTLYARAAQLGNGDILATWENYSPEPPAVSFPIYKSTDGGKTFASFSSIRDQVNSWGLRYQPFLYILPADFAGYAQGTVLAAGNSIPTDLSQTKIDVYASKDNGATWSFVSSVASGGEALPNNGLTPVWEPFLLLRDGTLTCFYSDQRDPAYGQKLVHQSTTDLQTWGKVVDDVAQPVYEQRPGMTIISQLPNRKWFMTFEYGGGSGLENYEFPVYYKISDSPLTFGNVEPQALVATDGTVPKGSPYNVWVPQGGENGTIVVNAASDGDLFVNTRLGEAGSSWKRVKIAQDEAYTRSLTAVNQNQQLLVVGAGDVGVDSLNDVTYSLLSLQALLAT